MRKILIAVAVLLVLFGVWRLGLLWLGPGAGTGGHDSADHDWQSLTDTSPKAEFESKFKKIQLGMSEEQVDKILAGYSGSFEELTALEKKLYGPPDGPYKRTPLFRKHYPEKPDAIERDYYIEVMFDDNYMVVDKEFGEYIK